MTADRNALAAATHEVHRLTHFSVAEIPFTLHAPGTLADLGLSRRYARFISASPPQTEATSIMWREGEPERVSTGERLLDPGDVWELHRRGDGQAGYCARIRYGEAAAPQAMVSANADWTVVEVIERRGKARWRSVLDVGAGELILRMRIPFCRGLLLHASAIDDHGRGLMFVGPSGAGKSTQVKLWTQEAGVRRVSDDRVAVRLTPTEPTAYDTPWGRPATSRRNSRVALSALLLLEQAPRNELLRLAPAEAAPRLLSRTFLPYGEAPLLDRAFATLEALLGLVPVYRLRCRADAAVIPLVRDGLCKYPTRN